MGIRGIGGELNVGNSGPIVETGERIKILSQWEQLGLDVTETYALVRNVSDSSSFIAYYATFALAEDAQIAETTGAGLPLIVVNDGS